MNLNRSPRDHAAVYNVPTITLLLCALSSLGPAFGQAANLVDTSHSEFAKLLPVGMHEVQWTDGFWSARTTTCYQQSIPSMWAIMKGTKYKPFLLHFLIAAGQERGDHHGAKWNDGDFYKWLEAAIVAAEATQDHKLQDAIEQSVQAIAKAQRADGYLHTPVLIAQRNGDLTAKPFQDRHAFEMYNMGHLMTTACLHYRVTGKQDLLAVAEKAAGFLIATFKNPTADLARNSVCPSHYMGTIELYRTTRDPRYLDLAKTFVAMRALVQDGGDDNQDRLPLSQQREAVGHAVRANYFNAGVADLYAETGDSNLLFPLEAIWDNMVGKKMYITGACGALYDGASPDGSPQQDQITRVHQAFGRNYQLPNITAHNETCANIANVMWCWRMFLVTGDAKYVDVLERALLNSVLSGVSLQGTDYFYVNPLRVVDPLPTTLRYPRTRQPFFTSFCCPPNVVRTVAEVAGYAYSKTSDSLWVNLYGANNLSTELFGQALQLSQQTQYPWDGTVQIKIEECPDQVFSLKLRIPSWAANATLSLNGETAEAEVRQGDFAELRRQWRAGDVLQLTLPMQPKLMQAHSLVEALINQLAVERGPLVYCLESVDLPAGVELEQIALPRDAMFRPRFDQRLLGGITVLEGAAYADRSQAGDRQLYSEVTATPTTEINVRLIPYYAWSNRGPSEMSVWMPAR